MKTIIFDIDGTLADIKHRRPFLEQEKPDWAAFNDAMGDDTPNTPVVTLYRTLWDSGQYNIILTSGRSESDRKITEQWLVWNDIPFGRLEMRKDTRGGKMTELVDLLIKHNPADYPLDTGHCFYEHKIRQFLSAAALGMTSASVWQGQYDATGGFIVVREDGALLCYHVYNWNDLQDYLFETTFLDQPSTGRHKYGMIEEENPDIIRLNFQVRFS